MAGRVCMVCGRDCGIRGFGRVCEACFGGPIRQDDGRMSLGVATETVVEAHKGHRRITRAHAAMQDARVTRYRPDGSVEFVKKPGRVISLPPGMAGR